MHNNKAIIKTMIFCFVLLFTGQLILGQQNEIRKTYDSYIQAKKSDNIATQIQFLHPKIFDFFPKDTLVKYYVMVQNFPNVNVDNEKLVSISETSTENDIKYALITFEQKITMDVSDIKNEGGSDFALSLMLTEFKKQYGENAVSFNKELYQVEMIETVEMYAIFNPTFDEWKFLSIDDDFPKITETIVPEKIRKKFETDLKTN